MSEEYTHKETRECITGGKQELYKKLSVERRVEQSTVPAFIWHTMEDKCVPVENSLMLVKIRSGIFFCHKSDSMDVASRIEL